MRPTAPHRESAIPRGFRPVFALPLTLTLMSLSACASQLRPPCVLPGVAACSLEGLDGAKLCPRLLRDPKPALRHLAAFPRGRYRRVAVSGQGRFWLDAVDDVIKNELRQGKPWERALQALWRPLLRPGSTVVDVGSHIGTHTLFFARIVGSEGRVLSLEPQRKLFRELVANVELNGARGNVIPLRYALGERQRVAAMNPTVRGNEGHTSLGRGGDPVEVRTLDSFALRNLSLLKIDVEGFEQQVLRGAAATIARERPAIAVEIEGGLDLDTAPRQRQRRGWATLAMLDALGYVVRRVGVHDYLALPRRGGLALAYRRLLPARAKPFLSEAGRWHANGVETTGRSGALLFGPYSYLPPGSYLVHWHGRVDKAGALTFDVVSHKGKRSYAKRLLRAKPGEEGRLFTLAFTLEQEVADVELRVVVSSEVRLRIQSAELCKLSEARLVSGKPRAGPGGA